jgi:hypothetical protein
VKQGDNLAPVLFLFAIQAATEPMNRNWRFDKPDLTVTPKHRINRRDNAKTGNDAAFVFPSRVRFGLTVHLGTKEPNRVTSKTEAMHIPARGTTLDPTATEDYDVLDNSRFISFYDSFASFIHDQDLSR